MKEFTGDLVYLMGCGKFDQFITTFRALLDPKWCAFCIQGKDEAAQIDAANYGHLSWYLKHNDFRLPNGVQAMMLIVPKRHLTDPRDLALSDWILIGQFFKRALVDAPGGGLVMRFGDPVHHAGTVPHLHINVISPTGEEEFRTPLSKTRESRVENYARLLGFRKELIEKGGLSHLFPE